MDVKFESHKDEVLKRLRDAVPVALEAIGIQAASHAKTELTRDPVRVDTGRLRNSIAFAVLGDAAFIGTNVEYALYVHEGTRKMAPNRFLKNAATRYSDEYKKIAKKILEDA